MIDMNHASPVQPVGRLRVEGLLEVGADGVGHNRGGMGSDAFGGPRPWIDAVERSGIVRGAEDNDRDSGGHFKGCVWYGCRVTRCRIVRAIVGNPQYDPPWHWAWTRGDW